MCVCVCVTVTVSVSVCAGDHLNPSMAVWSTRDYSLLSVTAPSSPVHDACWDPFTAYELATVGAGGHVAFWLLEQKRGREIELKVRGERERKREREIQLVICMYHS